MIKITDFYTNRCGPCKQMSIILDGIIEDNKDIELIKIDCEASKENLDLAIENGVRSVPVLIISSEKGSKRLDGLQSTQSILEAINELR